MADRVMAKSKPKWRRLHRSWVWGGWHYTFTTPGREALCKLRLRRHDVMRQLCCNPLRSTMWRPDWRRRYRGRLKVLTVSE